MKQKEAHCYVECPECESCFCVRKDAAIVPPHKCWAAEKIAKAEGSKP